MSFSPFPRGTSSLSVSHPYLALDGIYRPIRAAFPNDPTRRQRLVVRQGPGTTALSPSPAPLSRGLGLGPPLRTVLQTTIRTPRATDFQAGLFPAGFDNDPSAGSPTETLLRLLLPLNDMVQWTSRDVAGSEPPTSPRSEHFTGPFNRQIAPPTKNGHAPPPIESRKSSQSVNPYYVWTWINQVAFLRDVRLAWSSTHYLGRGEAITGREHRSCRGTKYRSYERQGLDPTLPRYSAFERTIEHRCFDIVKSCRSTHLRHRARLRSTKQPQGHLTDKGWQYIRNSIDLGTQHRIPIALLGLEGQKGRTLKRSAARQFDA
ncbi:hypothetical protein V6N13_040430 [Hibiscus sabdariffa]